MEEEWLALQKIDPPPLTISAEHAPPRESINTTFKKASTADYLGLIAMELGDLYTQQSSRNKLSETGRRWYDTYVQCVDKTFNEKKIGRENVLADFHGLLRELDILAKGETPDAAGLKRIRNGLYMLQTLSTHYQEDIEKRENMMGDMTALTRGFYATSAKAMLMIATMSSLKELPDYLSEELKEQIENFVTSGKHKALQEAERQQLEHMLAIELEGHDALYNNADIERKRRTGMQEQSDYHAFNIRLDKVHVALLGVLTEKIIEIGKELGMEFRTAKQSREL